LHMQEHKISFWVIITYQLSKERTLPRYGVT